MKTTTINVVTVAAPVLAATEALRAMSGLPWVFAVMLAVAIVSAGFGVAVVALGAIHAERAPLSVSEKRARVAA